jgi:hypothetical protein
MSLCRSTSRRSSPTAPIRSTPARSCSWLYDKHRWPFHVCHTLPMPVLHIEHRIADLSTWLQDFASRAPAREQGGVIATQVLQSEDDPQYIVELLFFDTADAAKNYRTFLREHVWSSPGLAGNPTAIILQELETAEV